MMEIQNPQDKLLMMLTEIYDRLEELEGVLEHSLTDLRSDFYQHQEAHLEFTNKKLQKVEMKIQNQRFNGKNIRDIPQAPQKGLKLEMGY
jgi:hypothetical protein